MSRSFFFSQLPLRWKLKHEYPAWVLHQIRIRMSKSPLRDRIKYAEYALYFGVSWRVAFRHLRNKETIHL